MRRSRSFVLLLLLAAFAAIQLSVKLAAADATVDDWEVEEGDDVYVGDGDDDEVGGGGGEAGSQGEVDESDVMVLTAENFADALKNHDYILVEFYAPWCGHCQQLKPHYAKAATVLKNEPTPVVLAKVDADAHKSLAVEYGVQGYPTLIWFEKGKKKDYKGEREADEIVEWVRGRFGAATVLVNTEEEAEAFLKANEQYVVGYFPKAEGAEFEAFGAIAKEEDALKFVVTSNAAMAQLLKVPSASSAVSIAMVKPEDEQVVVFEGEDLARFVLANKMPLVTPFTGKYSQRIFSCGVPKLLLLFVSKEDSAKWVPLFSEVAKTVKGDVLCVYVDMDDPAVSNVRSFFSISTKEPQVFGYLAVGDVGEQFNFDEGDLTLENLKKFAKRFAAGEVSIFYKSEDVPEKNDGPVTVVVGNTFDQTVLDESKDVLLEVYSLTCPHCKKLGPVYHDLGKRFSKVDSLVVAKINGDANDHPAIRVEGYPTIRLYPAGKKNESVDFTGKKNIADLTRFIKHNAAIPFTLERKPGAESVIVQKTEDAALRDEL